MVFYFSRSKLNGIGSHHNPFSVPIHTKPFFSFTILLTLSLEKPLAWFILLNRTCDWPKQGEKTECIKSKKNKLINFVFKINLNEWDSQNSFLNYFF
jgi:hypothetical protein